MNYDVYVVKIWRDEKGLKGYATESDAVLVPTPHNAQKFKDISEADTRLDELIKTTEPRYGTVIPVKTWAENPDGEQGESGPTAEASIRSQTEDLKSSLLEKNTPTGRNFTEIYGQGDKIFPAHAMETDSEAMPKATAENMQKALAKMSQAIDQATSRAVGQYNTGNAVVTYVLPDSDSDEISFTEVVMETPEEINTAVMRVNRDPFVVLKTNSGKRLYLRPHTIKKIEER